MCTTRFSDLGSLPTEAPLDRDPDREPPSPEGIWDQAAGQEPMSERPHPTPLWAVINTFKSISW